MKTLKLFSVATLLALFIYACDKQGATGPAGTNGANGQNGTANLTTNLYTVNPKNWDSINIVSLSLIYYEYDITSNALTDSSKDVVLIDESDSGSTIFAPIYEEFGGIVKYYYTNQKINIIYDNSRRPPFTMIFKVTIIPPAQMAFHHWNNTAEAREALNSNTINQATN